MNYQRKRLRLTTVVSLLSAVVILFSACGSAGGKDNRTLDEKGVYETGFPIVKEPVTLSIMTFDFNNGVDPKTTELMKALEKSTNIKLDWTVTTGHAAANLQAAYAADDLADIISGFYCDIAYQWPYIQQGMVMQLDDLIPKYAPNIAAMFKSQPYTKYMSTAMDGKIYSLPNVLEADDSDNSTGMLINTKWLKALGLKMPANTTDLVSVLRAFKNGDPNGNGKADEVPMMLHTDLPGEMYGWFGVSYNSEFPMYLKEGKEIAYAPLSEGYKSTLKFAASLANEKLLNTSFIDVDDLTGYSAVVNAAVETVGVVGGWNVTAFDMDSNRQLNDYAYLGALSADGAAFVNNTTGYPHIWSDKTLISSKCKNPEAALRFLDYFYGEEGAMWLAYGPPGDKNAWNIKDGKYVKTLNNCPADMTVSSWMNTLTVGQCLPTYTSKNLTI